MSQQMAVLIKFHLGFVRAPVPYRATLTIGPGGAEAPGPKQEGAREQLRRSLAGSAWIFPDEAIAKTPPHPHILNTATVEHL